MGQKIILVLMYSPVIADAKTFRLRNRLIITNGIEFFGETPVFQQFLGFPARHLFSIFTGHEKGDLGGDRQEDHMFGFLENLGVHINQRLQGCGEPADQDTRDLKIVTGNNLKFCVFTKFGGDLSGQPIEHFFDVWKEALIAVLKSCLHFFH